MMLALNEIKKNKLKYGLFTLMIALLACLILLLAGLSNGLSSGMNGAIKTSSGNLVILAAESEGNIVRSYLPIELAQSLQKMPAKAGKAAPLGHQATVAYVGDQSANIALFGYEVGSIAEPKPILKGSPLSKDDTNMAVVDQSFIKQHDLEVGDTFKIKGLANPVKIVGVTEGKRFSMQPSVFLQMNEWRKIRTEEMQDLITLILVQAPLGVPLSDSKEGFQYILGDELLVLTKEEAANGVPGVKEMRLIPLFLQWLSFATMIFIIGIFFYIILIQSTYKIALLKALGASNHYLVKSLLFRMLLIVFVGGFTGFFSAYWIHLWMPPSLSVHIGIDLIIKNAIILFFFSFISILLSVKKVISIPAETDVHRFI